MYLYLHVKNYLINNVLAIDEVKLANSTRDLTDAYWLRVWDNH